MIDRIIEKWTAHGLGIAFRISCRETSTDRIEQQFATPRWVKEAGAQGGFYRMGQPTGPDGPWGAGNSAPTTAHSPGPPHDAAGLAFSGGGIRSATFCLGVTQVLARRGLLPQFDYLSTISGGGYWGSFLSCALGTRQPGDTHPTTPASARERLADVFQRQAGTESGLLRHLRNHSKYLVHSGALGWMRILGLLFSGVLWNLMIMLPLPLLAALLVFLARPWLWGDAISANGPVLPALRGSPSAWPCGTGSS